MNPVVLHDAETLDPASWDEVRAIGHVMLDDMIDYVRTVRDRPVWESPSDEARDLLDAPLPREGRPLDEVYRDFKQAILPYPTGNIHPRFWGWVMGNGTPVGMLADLLGGAMNCHVSGYDQSATLVERQIVRWLAELLDMPPGCSGLLVSGGTAANLLGLTVARNHALGHGVRARGIGDAQPVVYASTETHGWIERSCDLLGLGEQALRSVPVDADHRIRLDALAAQIDADTSEGFTPLCLIGNAGTVACGATDDLHGLADIAHARNLWLHIDGAFGALAKLSHRRREIVAGLERADSVALDLHKWGYMQYEVGAVLVKDAAIHDATFEFAPSYLDTFRGGLAQAPTEFASKGIQLSRGFRALKVWMQLSTYGADAIGRIVDQNIDQVAYLRRLLHESPLFEQLGPSAMNVICFRACPPQMSEAEFDAFNRELLVRLHESGVAAPSNARIDGRFALRVAHTNHRSTPADFDLLVRTITGIATAMVES